MRATAILIVLALGTALAVWAATPAPKGKTATKTTSAKKTAKSTAKSSKAASKKAASGKQSASSKQTSSSKQVSSKNTSGKKTSGKRASAKTAASGYRRSTQREPAPERYKEIQQSLADKGYFAGPVNGTWNADSVEALKRFQRDQNIGDDGKLGSLSLIALGLGPKRGSEKSENPETGPTPP